MSSWATPEISPRETVPRESSLAARMDPAIGEASTGIGLLLAELVRRSLRTGVSELGDSLQTYATTQVNSAVEARLPELTVLATETSQRVSAEAVGRAVHEMTERSDRTAQEWNQNLQVAVDRWESELDSARKRTDATDATLQEIREKAKLSWKKFASELERLQAATVEFQQQLEQAQTREQAAATKLAAAEALLQEHRQQLHEQSQQLRVQGEQLQDQRQQLQEERQQLQTLAAQLELLQGRVVELERPRGLSALWQKLRGQSPSPPGGPENPG